MIEQYESKRITINCFAVQEICRLEGISPDAPSQVLAAAIEKLIFQLASGSISTPPKAQDPTPTPQPSANKAGLAAMVNQMKQTKSA